MCHEELKDPSREACEDEEGSFFFIGRLEKVKVNKELGTKKKKRTLNASRKRVLFNKKRKYKKITIFEFSPETNNLYDCS